MAPEFVGPRARHVGDRVAARHLQRTGRLRPGRIAGVVLLIGESPDVTGDGEDLCGGDEPIPWISVRVVPLAVTAARSSPSGLLMELLWRLRSRTMSRAI